ncbi:hypothetical protein [Pseudofulvibacter geojedonensis]|uniref:Uncharacterized protein n=1 Tax=Pseudofulvibacter geojedonensis TaxID=1123758 RepID=A0ABW3I3M9_9FLAO
MKHFLFLLVVVSSLTSYSQNKDIYTKKGFAIEGYDVVSYFDNKAEKETRNTKLLIMM